jgi:hypothetical protein
MVGQTRQLAKLAHVGCDAALLHFLDPAGEAQVFVHRHVGVERRLLRQVSDAPLDIPRLLHNISPVQQHLTLGGWNVAGRDVQRCGLARAISAQKAQDLANLNPEGNVPDGEHAAVSLGYAFSSIMRTPPCRNP